MTRVDLLLTAAAATLAAVTFDYRLAFVAVLALAYLPELRQ